MARKIARFLALLGIGLGLAELLATRRVAEAAGLAGRENEVRVFGWREIGSGALILLAPRPHRWLWTRVAGDALDAVLLGGAIAQGGERRARALRAAKVLLPIVLMDAVVAKIR